MLRYDVTVLYPACRRDQSLTHSQPHRPPSFQVDVAALEAQIAEKQAKLKGAKDMDHQASESALAWDQELLRRQAMATEMKKEYNKKVVSECNNEGVLPSARPAPDHSIAHAPTRPVTPLSSALPRPSRPNGSACPGGRVPLVLNRPQ